MSTHCPCTPSAQSVSALHPVSAPHAPDAPQSGPAAPPSAPHSASEAHARHEVEPQMGLAEAPSQPPLSTQSTQVAVAGSHWFCTAPDEHPELLPGSHAEQRPLRAPVDAHAPAPSATQRAFALAAASQATH